MQHLPFENTYKKTRLLHRQQNTEQPFKIAILFLIRRSQYKMCFTETEWKFLNDKHHQVSYFCRLPEIHKSKIIESAINTQKK